MVIYGTGGKSKNPGGFVVPYFCSKCDDFSSFLVTENYRYAHVYGIRLAKYKSKYFLVCVTCDRAMVLSGNGSFLAAQQISQTCYPGMDPDDLYKAIIRVAREVFDNEEFAKAIEKGDGK